MEKRKTPGEIRLSVSRVAQFHSRREWLEKVRKIDRASSKNVSTFHRCSKLPPETDPFGLGSKGKQCLNPASAHKTFEKLCAIPPSIVWKVWSRVFFSFFFPFFSYDEEGTRVSYVSLANAGMPTQSYVQRRLIVELPIYGDGEKSAIPRSNDQRTAVYL